MRLRPNRRATRTAPATAPPPPAPHLPSARAVVPRTGALRASRTPGQGARRMPPTSVRNGAAGADIPVWVRKTGDVAWRFLAAVGAVAVVVYGLLQVQLVLIAVFVALVLTSVLEPLVSWFAKVMPRPLATALGLLTSVTVVSGLLGYVVYSVADQWTALGKQFEVGINQILDLLENNPFPFSITVDDINEWIDQGQQWLVDHSGELVGQVFANAGTVFLAFTVVALALFVTVFLVYSGPQMWVWFLNQLPARGRERTHQAAAAGWYTFSGYARGTVIIAFIDGVLAFVLLIVVDVPLAAPLAVLVFIGAFIPLIGAPLAMIIAAVVALAANGFWPAVIVTLGIAGIGQIEGNILQPLIMGKQVSLHPVVVAIGVAAGTFLGGLLGAVVVIPLLAVIWSVFTMLRVPDPPMVGDLPSVKEIVGQREAAKG